MMLEMQADSLERQRKAVLADPAGHKLTTHFPEGARLAYRFFRVRGKRGPEVRYCYATERNLAGYFLSWRETIRADGSGKRDQWSASKQRKIAKARASARHDAHQARVGK